MIKNKKGFEHYLIALAIVSFILSIILILILSLVFINEPPNCKMYNISVKGCKLGNVGIITIKNLNNKNVLNYAVNGRTDPVNYPFISPKSSAKIKVDLTNIETIKIVPIFTDNNSINHFCTIEGKTIKIINLNKC